MNHRGTEDTERTGTGEVRFHDAVDDGQISFAVIVSRHRGRWVLCRHRERDTYEVPGGHLEPGESALEAARRELFEETGASRYAIRFVCAYSVVDAGGRSNRGAETIGMLYAAEIEEFGPLPDYEIAEVRLFDELPPNLTYPTIQPKLVARVLGLPVEARTDR